MNFVTWASPGCGQCIVFLVSHLELLRGQLTYIGANGQPSMVWRRRPEIFVTDPKIVCVNEAAGGTMTADISIRKRRRRGR